MTLIGENKIEERAKRKSLKEIEKDSIAGIFLDIDRQRGCATQAEVAIMFKMSTSCE